MSHLYATPGNSHRQLTTRENHLVRLAKYILDIVHIEWHSQWHTLLQYGGDHQVLLTETALLLIPTVTMSNY